jgi:hypothetical protein
LHSSFFPTLPVKCEMRRPIPKKHLCRSVPRFSRLVSSVLVLRLVLYHGLHGLPVVHICRYRSVAPLYPESFLLYCSWTQSSSSFWNNSQSAAYLSLSGTTLSKTLSSSSVLLRSSVHWVDQFTWYHGQPEPWCYDSESQKMRDEDSAVVCRKTINERSPTTCVFASQCFIVFDFASGSIYTQSMSEQVMFDSQCGTVMPLLPDTVVLNIGTINLNSTRIVSANSHESSISSGIMVGGKIGKTICLCVV